jgi:hypothetical protein
MRWAGRRTLTDVMSEGSPSPFRDEQGRLVRFGHLLGFTLAGFVIGLSTLLLVDAVLDWLDVSRFGRANGWLAALLPVWLLIEEFRAWRGQPGRFTPAFVGILVALALGTITTGMTNTLPPIASGAIGAAVAVLVYSLIWFYGIRWLGGRTGGPGR